MEYEYIYCENSLLTICDIDRMNFEEYDEQIDRFSNSLMFWAGIRYRQLITSKQEKIKLIWLGFIGI